MKPAPFPSWMLLSQGEEREMTSSTSQSQLQSVVCKRVQLEFGEKISDLHWRIQSSSNTTQSSTSGSESDNRAVSSLPKGHVEVAVMSVGLNFRDVLYAGQQYPALNETEGETHWHGCGAGVISAVRPDETKWHVGQAVFGIFCHPFATHTITSSELLLPKPGTHTHTKSFLSNLESC
jgi:hypothetical protein